MHGLLQISFERTAFGAHYDMIFPLFYFIRSMKVHFLSYLGSFCFDVYIDVFKIFTGKEKFGYLLVSMSIRL